MSLLPRQSKIDVLGVGVDALNMAATLHRLHLILTKRRAAYVCAVNVHGVMEAQRNASLLQIYDRADIVVPDGMPLVWIGRLQGHSLVQRVAGPDLMLAVFESPEFRHVRHFLYGGHPGVAELLKERLERRFPWAQIVGTWTPPFRDLTADEENRLRCVVNEASPDMLWVGIGCPRQELFMASHLAGLNVPLTLGVGAAFDFHTGRIHDCPNWVKVAGLQWMHRLVQDPRRLWKRYLRTNPAFLWHVGRQLLGWRKPRPAAHETSGRVGESLNKAMTIR